MKLALCISPALLVWVSSASADTILTVGPQAQYRTISDAANVANQDPEVTRYYVIEVAPGTYLNDFPHVKRPLTIEVDPKHVGEEVLLKATENIPNRKGIIVSEADLIVDGLSFEGAKTPDNLGGNAAGIRYENASNSAKLVIRSSTFVQNQNGILTSPNVFETITILNTKFKDNGNESITGGPLCCQHAVYISQAASLTVSDSLFCGQLVGHDIKSRALVSSISRNTLYVGATSRELGCKPGSGSFAIDLPNGGAVHISDNELIQGTEAQNHNLIAYGEEGLASAVNTVYLEHNTLTSSGVPNATAVYNPHCVPVQLVDNKFFGVSRITSPAQCEAN